MGSIPASGTKKQMYATKTMEGEMKDWIIETKDRIRWYFEDTVGRWPDKICMFIAWHLPRRLIMWCAMRLGAHATTGKYETQIVPELNFMDALDRWQ